MRRSDFPISDFLDALEEKSSPVRAIRKKFTVKPRPPAPRRLRPEAALQTRIVSWMRRALPPPPDGPYWSAVNPVPAKSLSVAMRSKAMGMKAGVADLLLVWKGRAIALELKSAKGALSSAQVAFRREWLLAGGLCNEVRTLEEFQLFLDVIGVPVRRVA